MAEAGAAMEKRSTHALALLHVLLAEVVRRREDAAQNGANWGNVGSMGEVAHKPQDLAEFFGVEHEAAAVVAQPAAR